MTLAGGKPLVHRGEAGDNVGGVHVPGSSHVSVGTEEIRVLLIQICTKVLPATIGDSSSLDTVQLVSPPLDCVRGHGQTTESILLKHRTVPNLNSSRILTKKKKKYSQSYESNKIQMKSAKSGMHNITYMVKSQ